MVSVLGLEIDPERTGHQPGVEMTHDPIGQPLFVTNRIHQARGKSTGSQDVIHHRDGIEIRMRARKTAMTKHDGGLGEIFLDQLDRSSFDRRGVFRIPCWRRPFFPGSEMGLYQRGGLFDRDVADDGEDDLGRGVFPPIKGLHVGQGDLAERLFRSIDRPTVGMAVEDELIERLHGDMARVVVVACHLAQQLGANPFEFLLMKRGVLQHVREQGKAEIDVFLEYAGGGGGEIF